MIKIDYKIQIIIHVAIAIAVYLFEPISKVYFLVILILGLYNIFNAPTKKRHLYVLISCAYVVGSEVFLRMTGGNFIYEASKYFIIIFLLIGIFLGDGFNKKSYIYILYLLVLIPGVIVASMTLDYDTNVRKAVAFNLSGPVCLGISALYCYKRPINIKGLQTILLAIILPMISTTVYLFLYNPSIRDVLSGTQSNFQASGGFGPNQVATVLGLGVFLLTGRLFLQSKVLFLKIINIFILALMSYRALVTFSRGGVLVAIITIVTFVIIFYFKSSILTKSRILYTGLIFGLGILFTWYISSLNTDGLIDKRYANQDALGRDKIDVSTGREALFVNELNEFFTNPFFGVGVGKLKELRFEKEGLKAASHNEISRIVGEHGVFGLIAFSILLFAPLFLRFRNKNNIYFYSFYLFWFLTINHSSMRIAAPAFIYGLCLLHVNYEKPSIHRKQIIK